MLQYLTLFAGVGGTWVIMADPARIKPEVKPERTSSANEEHPKSDGADDGPATSKPADVNKESSSQDPAKQEEKSVSPGAQG